MTTITITQRSIDGYVVRLRSSDSDLFRELIEALKTSIPHRWRDYDPDDKCWRIVSRGHLDIWLDCVSDYAGIQVIWDNDETHRRARQDLPPPRRPGRMVPADAFTALYLLPTAPPEVIKASYKALALIHHPDRGGDLEQMKTINQAYDLLEKGAA